MASSMPMENAAADTAGVAGRLQRARDDLSSSEVLGMPTLKMSAMALRIGGVDWLYAGYIRVYVAAPRCP